MYIFTLVLTTHDRAITRCIGLFTSHLNAEKIIFGEGKNIQQDIFDEAIIEKVEYNKLYPTVDEIMIYQWNGRKFSFLESRDNLNCKSIVNIG